MPCLAFSRFIVILLLGVTTHMLLVGCEKKEAKPPASNPGRGFGFSPSSKGSAETKPANAPETPADTFEPTARMYFDQLRRFVTTDNSTNDRIIRLDNTFTATPIPLPAGASGTPTKGKIALSGTITQPNERDPLVSWEVTVFLAYRKTRWDYDRAEIKSKYIGPALETRQMQNSLVERMNALLSNYLLMSGVAMEKNLELKQNTK